MNILTAKVFKAGNSKAVRLPGSLKVKAKTYTITAMNGGLFLSDPAEEVRRAKALKKLMSLKPLDFEIPRP